MDAETTFVATEIPMDAITTESAAPKEAAATPVAEDTDDAVREDEAPEGEEGDAEGAEEGVETAEETTEEADDEIEIDLGGTKAKFKKGDTVEKAAERLQDFAKDLYRGFVDKTTKVAEMRKELEAQNAALEVMTKMSADYYRDYGKAQVIQDELTQLQSIDWRQLWNNDANKARQLSDLARMKEQELGRLVQTLQATEREAAAKRQEFTRQSHEAGRARVEKAIPGFSERHAAELVEYAVSVGLPKEDAENWAASPEIAVMAWKAMQFDRASKEAKKPTQPKAPAKPVTPKAKSGSRATRDITNPSVARQMSDEQWIRADLERARKARSR